MIGCIMYKGQPTDYTISDRGIAFKKNGKPFKNRFMPNGYQQLCLRINGAYKYLYLHRAVFEAFVGKIPDGMEINHLDGNKQNNALDNLIAVLPQENINHSWKAGLSYRHNPHVRHHVERRLEERFPREIIREICKTLESPKFTYAEIAEMYNTEPSMIYNIANGRLWPEISSNYDIGSRMCKRAEFYKERDEKIKELRRCGWKIQEIADELGMTFDAVARRMALMRQSGIM